jgi:catechol 2,3-dioxygenase-like lactoylglutathione lyase family enzyme
MIGYVTIGTNNIERARAFYDALLGTIGAKRVMEREDGMTMWSTEWGAGLAITRPYDGGTALPGNGIMVALVVESRNTVDALYRKALTLGGRDEGLPGLRGPEGPRAFYAAYFRDLDNNKLCVFRMGPG